MQDRYAGDVGDFLKYALLRWLARPDWSAPLRLGVVWYLYPDEGHNADGKHIAYLDPAHRLAKRLRPLEPDLYDRLQAMVPTARSVAAVESAGVLPPNTRTFAAPIDFAGASTARERQRFRQSWLDAALDATDDCGLVFVDPDNGLRRDNHKKAPHHAKAGKHAYVHEIAKFTGRGQSVVTYHHADRSAPVPEQIDRRLAELLNLDGGMPLAAVVARRGSVRLFLIAATPQHESRLRGRLVELERSGLGSELSVVWSET